MPDLPRVEVRADGVDSSHTALSIDGQEQQFVTQFRYSVIAPGDNRIEIEMHGRVDLDVRGVAVAMFPDGTRLLFRGVEPIPPDATPREIERMIADFTEGT